MSDTGQDIIITDEISLADLQKQLNDLEGRITLLTNDKIVKGDLVKIRYRNYYKKSGKREKDSNGAWKLNELIEKWVRIT